MKNKESFDELLIQALRVEEKPSQELNKKIIEQISKDEKVRMKKCSSTFKKWTIAIAIGVISTVSLYAARNLLTSKEVATEIEDYTLALAFDGKDAIRIEESKVCGEYSITLQGIVSGESISHFANSAQEDYPCRTYAVVSIARIDGRPMRADYEDSSEIFVSPYIRGVRPWQCNLATMNGSSTQFIKDGILYRVIECDNIEIFADRGLYMGVSLNGIVDSNDFHYDETTGQISEKKDAKVESILFNLPIDKSKADPEAAEEYINKKTIIEMSSKSNEQTHDDMTTDQLPTVEELISKATLIEESVLQIDQEGMVHYEYSLKQDESGKSSYLVEAFFNEGEVKEDVLVSSNRMLREWKNGEPFYFTTLSQNEKGIITAKRYVINMDN